MLPIHDFVRVLVLSLSGLLLRCQCTDQPFRQKKCYEAGYHTICFFRPEPEYKWMLWTEASQTCLSNNASLPTIHNAKAQGAFESYMNFLKLVDLADFWMGGREVRGEDWKWLNGRTANLTQRQFNASNRDSYVQGVLTNKMLYETDIPSKRNHFICQFYDTACLSNITVALRNKSCILLNSERTMNLYDARNWCVKEGGDLAVIDKRDDLSRLREIITLIPNVSKVWIGLRRQWWTWNETDPAMEMKYSNWLPGDGYKSNMDCMKSDMNGYKWRQESCNSSQQFVCQTVSVIAKILSPQSFTVSTLVPIASIAAILILLVAIVLAVVIRKRKARKDQVTRPQSDRSYQDLHDKPENQYAALQVATQEQPDLSPDYQNILDYDDVIVSHVPNYIDIE